jgi:hypothetical protein
MFETEAGESPVTRAISAWLSTPRDLTAANTRRMFAARSDAWEPGLRVTLHR